MSEVSKPELGPLWDIVVLLSDGEFHSGENLGAILGVSRAAVWKHLQKLEGFGIQLSSVKGRGYRIVGGLDLMDQSVIAKQLTSTAPLTLHVLPQIDSTNSFLMRQSSRSMQVCLAEFQSAGKGRRGRAWVSPLAQNIYCSIGWEFEGGAAVLEGLSLAIGVAIVRAFGKFGVNGLTLKWPNDILFQGKKLGGVLIEMTGDPAGCCHVIVGVGVNISMHGSRVAIDQPWIALNSILAEQSLAQVSRNNCAAMLINECVAVLQTYHQQGFSAYRSEWMRHADYVGTEVELRNGQNSLSGLFQGVTNTGALRLDVGGTEHVFHGGEVSLRHAS